MSFSYELTPARGNVGTKSSRQESKQWARRSRTRTCVHAQFERQEGRQKEELEENFSDKAKLGKGMAS